MGQPSELLSTDLVPLPATPGRDLATLALLPLTVAAQEPVAEPVSRAYQLPVDGRQRRISVTLTPGECGLPTHADGMIYLGLLQLQLEDPEGERLEFHRPALFDLLRWPRKGGNYSRLREALLRLHQLSITIDSALITRAGREYRRSTDAAHLIDRFHLADGAEEGCWVEWGALVREAMVLGDFKRLDWDLLLALGNPLTAQVYRLLDRVVMSGEQDWRIGWRPLAHALGMHAEGYARPARFRQRLEPHLEALVEHGVLAGWAYERGGQFVFQVHNYLRAQLRRLLAEAGVYPEAARQLVAGYDEVAIMGQMDCLTHGTRPTPDKPGGYLVDAVREGYELRYPPDEAAAFCGLWQMLGPAEREAYHRAGLKVCGLGDSLFDTSPDPTAWTLDMRATVRFLISHNLDPAEMS